MLLRTLAILFLALSPMLPVLPAHAQVLRDTLPNEIDGLEIRDTRGEAIPRDIPIINAQGETVLIGDYFEGDRPIVLLLVYYSCPKMCEAMLGHMNQVINDVTFDVGDDYQVLVVSFDHRNTTSMARNKETYHHAAYQRGLDETGRESFTFHTARAQDARRLADSVGFDYRFLPQSGEFSHPSVMYILTPDGRVSNYLSGMGYESKQLRVALLGASDGQIAESIIDSFMYFCFVYDPNAGAWNANAMKIMQVGGVLSILGVGTLVIGLHIAERIRRRTRSLGIKTESNDRAPRADSDRPVRVPTISGAST